MSAPKRNSSSHPSTSIIHGSNNLMLLFEEEAKKRKLQHHAELGDLQQHFKKYRLTASEENTKANARIKELEEEVVRLRGELARAKESPKSQHDAQILRVDDFAGQVDPSAKNPDSSLPQLAQYSTARNQELMGFEQQLEATQRQHHVQARINETLESVAQNALPVGESVVSEPNLTN